MNPRRFLTSLLLLTAVPLLSQPKELERGPYRLNVSLERHVDGEWSQVAPGQVFESGDRVRFRVQSNFDGYLHVANQGTSGEYASLFPTDEAGADNRIVAGQEYVVPQTEGAFRITGPAGHEVVYWTATPNLSGDPAAADAPPAPAPPPPAQPPARLTPRCDETILRARGDCIDHTAGLKDPNADLRGRGLVFLKKDDDAVVAASPQLQGPVTFEFRLAHR